MPADPAKTAHRTPADWTAAECAEDLLAQLEELLEAGATLAQLSDALVREGLHEPTAVALGGLLERRKPRETEVVAAPKLDPTAVCGVDTVAFRHWFRKQAEQTQLVHALTVEGCPAELAAAVVAELAGAEAAFAAHQRARLRSLGLQAMIAGTIFTLALLWFASGPGPYAFWHALPAIATIALVAYGAVLRRRHAEPHGAAPIDPAS